MSKERELLEKINAFVLDKHLTISEFEMETEIYETFLEMETEIYETFLEVRELLAQPEQEPVGIVITIGGYPDDSEHTVKLTCRHVDLKDGDLLYTAPQKRKHLTGIEISQGFQTDDDATHPYSYWSGVDFAEKAHGITGVDDE